MNIHKYGKVSWTGNEQGTPGLLIHGLLDQVDRCLNYFATDFHVFKEPVVCQQIQIQIWKSSEFDDFVVPSRIKVKKHLYKIRKNKVT